jgi:NitT/TauT family transport system substrate-binding protein
MRGDGMLSRSAAIIALLYVVFCCGPVLASGNEAKPVKLKVGMAGIEPGMCGVWMAKEKGFFQEENIEVELVNFNSGTEGVFALASGDLPVTVVGGPAAARGIVAGLDIKFTAELLDSLPYILFVSKNISAPADLVGKRIAITALGGTTEFVIRLILARLKLQADQVLLLGMGGESNRLAALEAGSTDATILLPPCSTTARKLGYKEFQGGNAEGIRGQQDYLVASGRALNEQRDTLIHLLRAIIKGSRYFKTHPDEGRMCLVKYLQMEDPEGLADTYETYGKLLTANGSVNSEGLQLLLEFIGDQKSRELKPGDLIDTRLIDELEKNGDIERINKQ